jgi:hypothetical protein
MASSKTKLELVELACMQAGRGAELHGHAKDLLDLMLKSWALKAKYPTLRKIGSEVTLAAGTCTVALPTDLGAGSENMLFSDSGKPMDEKAPDEFLSSGLFPIAGRTGRPCFYMLDKEASLIRFNTYADQNYTLIPIYFKIPPALIADTDTVWHEDDEGIVQGLVELIYQYKEDPRELAQGQKVDNKLANYRRGTVPTGGGTSRMRLSSRFK